MTADTTAVPIAARSTWGGDEFLFVEVDEAMSLAANVRVVSIPHRRAGAGNENNAAASASR